MKLAVILTFVWVYLAEFVAVGRANTLQVHNHQTCFFPASRVSLPVSVEGGEDGVFSVSFTLFFEQAVVARRQLSFAVREGRSEYETVIFELPEIRDGVSLKGRYRLELVDAHGKIMDAVDSPLHVLDPDPFRYRQQWLKAQRLHVYDPEGKTVARLESSGVPFVRIMNPAAFGEAAGGVLVIGEGLSLRSSRGIVDAALATVPKQTSVIVLAPLDGSFVLHAAGENRNAVQARNPGEMRFHGSGMISGLDKRLDATDWGGPGGNVLRYFNLEAYGNQPEVRVDPNKGWSGITIAWATGQVVYFCGFAVMRDWDTSPAPRYFFAALLEMIGDERRKTEDR